jgi:hypothetical protein
MARTTYRGTCLLCGKKSTKAGIARHLKGCVAAHQPEEIKAKSGDLVHLRVEATHSPLYWLDIELSGERTLRHLDQFLRREWVGGEPARWICSFCYDDPEPFYCEEHGANHECGEEGLLPVVDSPRMGVCAYGF